jgi:O-antigen/teichoic acid export membrane protein
MKTNQFFKKSGIYYLSSLLAMLFGLISFPILAKNLSLNEFGMLDLINTINSIFIIITSLGAGIVVQQIIYVDDQQNIKKNLGNQFIINTISFLTFSILFVFFYKYVLPTSFNNQLSILVIGYLLVFTSANNFNKYISEIYRFRSWAIRFASLQIIPILGMFIIVVFLYQISALCLINLLKGYIIVNVSYLLLVVCLDSKEVTLAVNFQTIWRYFKLGLVSMPVYAVILINRYVDRWFIIRYTSMEDLGLYSINIKLALLGTGVVAALNNVLLPEFVKNLHSGKRNEINFMIGIAQIVFICLSLSIFFFGKEFVSVFSKPRYFENYLTVFFSSIFLFFFFLNHLLHPFILFENKVKYMGIAYTMGAVVNIFFNYLFIPKMGYPAAALSSLMSQVTVFFFGVYLASDHIKHFKMVKELVVAIASLFAGYIIVNWYDTGVYLSEIILKLLLVLVTFLFLFLISKTVSLKGSMTNQYMQINIK